MLSSSAVRAAWVVVAVCCVRAPAAHADKAAADAAFAEAKRLMTAGKIADACPKFEFSYAQDPQVGTLLNLADCHEQVGKLATAWAEFRAALELAHNRGDAREAFAKERSDALAIRISYLVVQKPAADAPGLQVYLDDRDVTALIGVPIPIDPGRHVVRTTATGAAPGRSVLEVVEEGSTIELAVPLAGTTRDDPPTATGGGSRRLAGVVLAGAGLVSAGVGLYFGTQAYARWDDSRAFCDGDQVCEPRGAALVDDAKSAALKANLLVGAGAGALVVGALLWLTAPNEVARGTVSAQPIVTPSTVGGSVMVRF